MLNHELWAVLNMADRGLSTKDIAKILGRSQNSTSVLLDKARQRRAIALNLGIPPSPLVQDDYAGTEADIKVKLLVKSWRTD